KHRGDLSARKLTGEQIERNQYRSLDFLGSMRAAEGLYQKYGAELAKVPGFEIGEGQPRVIRSEGLLIPVRDRQGRIIACQVRLGYKSQKYAWLSSSAASSGAPCHVPLGIRTSPVVRLTEGALKADVAWAL